MDATFEARARGEPAQFREFLLDAPAKFTPLGEALGAVKHIYAFWGFRFPETGTPRLEAMEARELMEESDSTLASVTLVAGLPVEDLMLS